MGSESGLGQRQHDVLVSIIRHYVAGGSPVGSKSVADDFGEPVSSATVRNCMAELEDGGYLEQPHVSAGRVPTDQAYRYYVDRVLGTARLAPEAEKYISDSLNLESSSAEQLMARTSHVLSEVSRNVGLVLGPTLEEKLLEHIKFVKLPDRRVLAVIVSKPDVVENRMMRLEDDFSQGELDRTAEYLNTEYQGWSLRAIRLDILKRMEEMKQLSDRLISNVTRLLVWGTLAEEGESQVLFVDGTAKILDQPEFEEAARLRALLATLEQKAKLIRILNACLHSSTPGIRVLIGRENPSVEMQECALIMAPYYYRDRAVGALGVVGPKRMEYERSVTAVDYVAHLYSRLLGDN